MKKTARSTITEAHLASNWNQLTGRVLQDSHSLSVLVGAATSITPEDHKKDPLSMDRVHVVPAAVAREMAAANKNELVERPYATGPRTVLNDIGQVYSKGMHIIYVNSNKQPVVALVPSTNHREYSGRVARNEAVLA